LDLSGTSLRKELLRSDTRERLHGIEELFAEREVAA
jgi:hypothetical protein